MTPEQAQRLSGTETLYDSTWNNADGTPARWRVNGALQVRKRAGTWRLPVKRGLREFGYVTPENCRYLHLTKEAAIAARGQ